MDAADPAKNETIAGQLLGAIVPQGKTTWFFKLTGPVANVHPLVERFAEFARSIRFTDKGPEWSLPEGWEQQAGSSMRFATLRIPAEGEPLELTVIPLPTPGDDFEASLLSNVNRWREQLQLPPVSRDELPDHVEKIDLVEMPAWLVNYEGRLSKKGAMGAAPFAGRRSSRREAAPPGRNSPNSLPFTCSVPEGWRAVQENAMQIAAYEVGDGDQQAEISVSVAGGELAANINRWREQVHLPPLEAAELKSSLRSIDVDGHTGVIAEFAGPESDSRRESLLGVIVTVGRQQWFIKLRGDSQVVAREKVHFEEFVRSIRFRNV